LHDDMHNSLVSNRCLEMKLSIDIGFMMFSLK
jgi:hypothetical protein